MVRQEARFHMAMLLSEYSNQIANNFDTRFEHQDRERSSDRMEMIELNDWWANELKGHSPILAQRARKLPVDSGIDSWLHDFKERILPHVINHWR